MDEYASHRQKEKVIPTKKKKKKARKWEAEVEISIAHSECNAKET